MSNIQQLWDQVKQNIKNKNATNQPLLMWFEPTTILTAEETPTGLHIKLGVPTELHHYWISNNLLSLIFEEFSAIYNSTFNIDLVVHKESQLVGNESQFQQTELPLETEPSQTSQSIAHAFANNENPDLAKNKDVLNSEHTFSTFVVGRNNEFAHAACYSIAKDPGGHTYNPLFICGPTGMGKTHLLHAVGNHVKNNFSNLIIKYCSAERFLNECIQSIRRNEMHKFRKRYRENCNVLLMDDIQVLGRGEAVQEEFFHTLNDFFEKGNQVVVASDRMPKDIIGLEDRIRTRLEWGLIADIQMPDIETRVAILKYKAEIKSLNIPQDVVNYIARISKRSIRELEGNLNKIKMFSELQGLRISLDLAKKVLASHDDTVSITIDEIQKIVADHFKLRVTDLKAKSRTQPIVTARQVAMFMIKKHLDKPLVEIGRSFGGKDHTTVINALRKIENQLGQNLDLKRNIEEIETRIHNITGV